MKNRRNKIPYIVFFVFFSIVIIYIFKGTGYYVVGEFYQGDGVPVDWSEVLKHLPQIIFISLATTIIVYYLEGKLKKKEKNNNLP